MDSNEKKLPSKWEKANLEDLISKSGIFSDGDWVESKDQDPQGATRLLQLADIGDASFINKSSRHVNDEQFNRLNCTEVLEGDILIARMPDPLGRCCITPKLNQRLITVVDVAIVRPGENSVDAKWLMHTINSPQIRELISIQATGTTRKRITRKKLAKLLLPIPPLNEQRRIADKLDTTLAAVEACKQKLNNAAETIQRFRQSVLAAAVSGELTREWREEKGIEKEWEEITAKEAGKIQLGRQRSPKYHSGQTMRPYLRVQNVFEDRIDLEDVMAMDFPGKDLEKYKLHYGDILLNEGQSPQYLGRPAMYRDELDEACFTNTLIRFQANIQIVNPNFALLVFRHNMHSGRYISEGKITTNIAHLSLGRFGETEFPLPSLDEQEQISNTAADLFAQADSIGAAITSGLHAIERLSSSILAKAFRGELVPQDPNDEPASVLLERIKVQREAEEAAKKPAKRGRKRKADAAQIVIPEDIADNHLAKVLEECGAISQRALLAASELEPAVFQLQLTKEIDAGGLKRVDVDGEAAYADAAWEEEG